ncbi:hypothetical protein FDP41_008664 [Naegleria fowleri]|uniref:DUF1279 domain-containing protein n=1 Tax=Naegleria fowleri TaxID=5763 RepID=A0A6A5BG51_NAEFO|nr:uncharacterized protein FDP41_008664 [Naegleria fowleri]KAF0973000.1 hypothetical protein FDP41_008664 [Naegleria fowleri]
MSRYCGHSLIKSRQDSLTSQRLDFHSLSVFYNHNNNNNFSSHTFSSPSTTASHETPHSTLEPSSINSAKAHHSNKPTTTATTATTIDENTEKFSLLGKIKRFIKTYGFMGLFLYFFMYFSTLGFLFVILHQNILPTRQVLEFLSENGFRSFIGDSEKLETSQKYANFVLAYIVNRLLEPIRLVMTYRWTPKVS